MKLKKASNGFSLIEVLFALMILTFGLISLAAAFNTVVATEQRSIDHSTASAITMYADSYLSELNNGDIEALYTSIGGSTSERIYPGVGSAIAFPDDSRFSFQYHIEPVSGLNGVYDVEIIVYQFYDRLGQPKPGGDIYVESDLEKSTIETWKVKP
jgi:type II secretory pathway pseudopilin PulG